MSVEMMLQTIPFFQKLTGQQLQQLANVGTTETWEADRVVVAEGGSADQLYLILEGVVRVYKKTSAENEVELRRLTEGGFFGEMALFERTQRSASVATVTPCKFFVLRREAFLQQLTDSPQLALELFAGMSGKLRTLGEKFLSEQIEKEKLHAQMERERYRSLAQMVAGVAHELNTPLGIVNTAASIIVERLTPDLVARLASDVESRAVLEEACEAAGLIQGNLERANKLIQSFKNLSVSQAVHVREKLNLPLFVDEIVGLFKPQARRANLQIAIDDRLPEHMKEWVGYPGYLSQILLNLLSNIERYAYPGGGGGPVEIDLAVDTQKKEPAFILTVRDFGQGIAANDLAKIFEAFFTTGRDRGGTGLGMTIVYNLVTSGLKGSIDVASRLGHGTTVTITLPLVVPEQPASAAL